MNGGGLSAASSFTLNSNRSLALIGNGSLDAAAGQTLTYAGYAAGFGALSKTGAGTLALNAATSTAGFTLSAGTLQVGNAGALGKGLLTLAGGTFDNATGSALTLTGNNAQAWTGDFTFTGTNNLNLGTGAVTLTGNRTATVSGNTLTVGGLVTGSSSTLTKAGAGNLVLNGAVNLGGLAVSAGTLSFGSSVSAVTVPALTGTGGTIS